MTDHQTNARAQSGSAVFSRLCVLSVLFILTCLLSACGEGPVWMRDDPRTVLAGYLQEAEYQDTASMWEYLSADTRGKLDSLAADFNASEANGKPRKGHEMLCPGHVLATTREYRKLEIISSNNEIAVLHIILHDDTYKTVTLHKEEGRWAINLPI